MCAWLDLKGTRENAALKPVQAEQEISLLVGVPSGAVAGHPEGIRSYSRSWNWKRQLRQQRLFIVIAPIRASAQADVPSIPALLPPRRRDASVPERVKI